MIRSGRWVVGFGAFVLLACASRPASATDKRGAVQLSLDGSLLRYQTLKTTSRAPDPNRSSGDLSLETNQSLTTYGPAGAGLGVGLGYAVSNQLVLGLRTSFSGSAGTTDVAVLPRLEVLFDTDPARIFLAGMVGLSGASGSLDAPNSPKVDTTRSAYLFGASTGVHAFVSDTFSLDPMLTVLGFSGSQTLKSHPSGDPETSQTTDVSGVQVMLTFGFSAWLGSAAKDTIPMPPVADSSLPDDAEGGLAGGETNAPLGALANDSNWVAIPLPRQHVLYLKKTKHPERTTVSASLVESKDRWDLVGCAQIGVVDAGQLSKLNEAERHEDGTEHSVTGKLPLHAIELLANGSSFDLCAKHLQLNQAARAVVRDYLQHRALEGSPAAPEPGAAPVAPPADPAAPPADPAAPVPAPAPKP